MLSLRISLWSLAILVAVAHGADLPVIPVCEALTHSDLYNHKIVAIRGVQMAGSEGGWLNGEGCDRAFVTNGYVWPSIIWLEMSESDRLAAGIPAPERYASIKRINSELKRKGYDVTRDRLTITYVGLFEVYDDSKSGIHLDSRFVNAPGFGHLNGAPAQIIVIDVKDLSIEKRPKSRPRK
jgi:hypothetical protein